MNFRSPRCLPVLAVALIASVQLGSQASQATITFTGIPAWGQDGVLTGYASGGDSQQFRLYIFVFVPDLGWSGLPQNCSPVPVQSTGQFSVNAAPNIAFRSATRFTAYLMP